MLILSKKRVYIILVCLILATLTFGIKSLNKPEVEETVALPVNNKIIILDAGHGRRRSEVQQQQMEYQNLALI